MGEREREGERVCTHCQLSSTTLHPPSDPRRTPAKQRSFPLPRKSRFVSLRRAPVLLLPMATAFYPIAASTSLSPISSSSSRLASVRLPEVRGLRIGPAYATRSVKSVSLNSRRNRIAAAAVVCEAQDTALEGSDRRSAASC